MCEHKKTQTHKKNHLTNNTKGKSPTKLKKVLRQCLQLQNSNITRNRPEISKRSPTKAAIGKVKEMQRQQTTKLVTKNTKKKTRKDKRIQAKLIQKQFKSCKRYK